MTRDPRKHGTITRRKAQRAMDAIVALLETREIDRGDIKALDDACDTIRKYRDAAAR